MFKVNYKDTRTTLLVFQLLTLNMSLLAGLLGKGNDIFPVTGYFGCYPTRQTSI